LILEGYGVGENVLRIIKEVWDMDTMMPKQPGFYGKTLGASRARDLDRLQNAQTNRVDDYFLRRTRDG
jgi:hypothetical protein